MKRLLFLKQLVYTEHLLSCTLGTILVPRNNLHSITSLLSFQFILTHDQSHPLRQRRTGLDRAGPDGCDINGKWSWVDGTPQSYSGICHCPGHADWVSYAHWLRLMMTVVLSLSPWVAFTSIAQSLNMTCLILTLDRLDTTCTQMGKYCALIILLPFILMVGKWLMGYVSFIVCISWEMSYG